MPAANSKKTDKKPAAPKTAAKATPAKTKAPAAPKAKQAAATKPASQAKAAAKPAKAARPPVGTDQRRHYIEVAAYYIAERRGFSGGDALEDWAAAEVEIDRLLAEGLLNA